ncbi:MAG: radical SAM protein [Chloroflexi bacterium]|nr:radical SAM protein [Chloroflexota bacterium]
MTASYVALHKSGELARRAKIAWEMLAECRICPRSCKVNRLQGETSQCRTADKPVVCSFHAHFGEESPLVGRHGSGTIFFTHCNLRCLYCQNYTISQLGEGQVTEIEDLAKMMLALQRARCHNINFVSPTHVVPQILAALELAARHGLTIPLVYNTGGYDSLETLELLDGIIDVYMPDMKYSDEQTAKRLSGIANYPELNRLAVKEMHRQVGDLVVDEQGVAQRGLLVRHLVLPGGLSGSEDVFRFLAQEISTDTYLNIMDQYRPCYKAGEHPPLNRPLTKEEYQEAVERALQYGLTRLDRPRRLFIFWE